MSQHRQHYFEANFRPEAEPALETNVGRAIAVILVALAAVCAAGSYAHSRLTTSDAVITPVRTPEIVHYELPPLEVQEARVDGFRAGYATAMEQQGCTPTLTQPIANR